MADIPVRLRLEGVDGDNVILSVKGDSKYLNKNLVFSNKNFLEFLKLCKTRPRDYDFLMEVNDSLLETQKKFLR